MTTVYDKNGKGYDVPHAVDVDGWLEAGYTLDKPEEKKTRAKKDESE